MTHFEIQHVGYKPTLTVIDERDGPEEIGLYSVVVTSPMKGTNTHYVLAKSPAAASGMGRCAEKVAEYEVSDDVKPLIKTVVTRLPLTVQGWGIQKM